MTADDGTIAWRVLYDEARRRLAVVADTPDVDARRIVEEASGYEGVDFALGLHELVTERGVARPPYDESLPSLCSGAGVI